MMKSIGKRLLLLLLAGAPLLYGTGWKENFTCAGADGIPAGWEYQDGPFGVDDLRFTIAKEASAEDGSVLRIESDAASGVIVTDAYRGVDLAKTPIMHWRWRVVTPTRPTRDDDQAVVVYFGAIDWLKKKSVGYRWETLIPVGTAGHASYGAGLVQLHYCVLRDRATPVGEWVEDQRNVRKEFEAAYGYIPAEFAVSIGANSQYTNSNSVAEIDYIEFLTPEEAQRLETKPAARETGPVEGEEAKPADATPAGDEQAKPKES